MKTLSVKKICFALAAILFLGVLLACNGMGLDSKTSQNSESGSGGMTGQNGEIPGNTGGSGVYDISSDKKQLIAVVKEDLKGDLTGVQFYQEEPVMLSAQEKSAEGKKTCDIYLYRPGEEAKLIAEGLPSEVRRGAGFGFLDEEGCYYHIKGGSLGSAGAVITKYDSSGQKIFAVERNAADLQMCSLADGKIALFYRDNATGNIVLELLDRMTGAISEIKLNCTTEYNVFLGTDGTYPYLLDSHGVSRVDPEEGSITIQLRFSGSSYGLNLTSAMENGSISGFRVKENEDVELLWGRRLSTGLSASLNVPPGTVWVETIQRMTVDENRTFLTIRGMWMNDSWLKERIVEFNDKSRDYYVLVEIPEDGVSDEDYVTRTLVELGTGKGPDILYGKPILGNSLYSLIENGTLEDLAPYIERSGMKREDYFPLAFGGDRSGEKVYEIIFDTDVLTQIVDGSLFGDADSMDINTFLDTLLTLGNKAVYQANTDSGQLLQNFLEGSENLWGMVDWGSGTCDFDTDLFAKLLQAAKNLGASDKKNYIPVSEKIYDTSFASFVYNRDRMSKAQMILGKLFDDGCHGMVNTRFSLQVNANSPNKEGVWEFLSYLLSREAQETQISPVHREAFARRAEKQIAEDANHEGSMLFPLVTKEAAAEFETYLMEDVRFTSIRVQPLIDIISEEAQDYFNGIKDIGHVRTVVKNRVQLYLDENH